MAFPEELAELAQRLRALCAVGITSINISVEVDPPKDAEYEDDKYLVQEIFVSMGEGIQINIDPLIGSSQADIAKMLRTEIHEVIERTKVRHEASQAHLAALGASLTVLTGFIPSPLEELAQQAEFADE